MNEPGVSPAPEIRRCLRKTPPSTVPAWRRMRRAWSQQIRRLSGTQVLRLALELVDEGRWGRLTAYELVVCHAGAVRSLTTRWVNRLRRGLSDDWGSIDTFACYIAGPAWRNGQLPTRQIHRWLRSTDRWTRRLAVVCTIPLNVPAQGGWGDVRRTLNVCRRVAGDGDDMVIKAVSWSLRSLVRWDRDAVELFLERYRRQLAARITREVRNKLDTGRKEPRGQRGTRQPGEATARG